MKTLSLGEIYRREAERLRSMADAFIYYEARDEFLAVARRFEELAQRREHQDTTTRDRAALTAAS